MCEMTPVRKVSGGEDLIRKVSEDRDELVVEEQIITGVTTSLTVFRRILDEAL